MAYEQIVEQAVADNWPAREARAAANDPAMEQKFRLMAQWAMIILSGHQGALVEFMETYPTYMHNLSEQLMANGHNRLIISGLMATAHNYPALLLAEQPDAPAQEFILLKSVA